MDFSVKKLASGAGLFLTRAVQVIKRAEKCCGFCCRILSLWQSVVTSVNNNLVQSFMTLRYIAMSNVTLHISI